jgi:hypothetical protein
MSYGDSFVYNGVKFITGDKIECAIDRHKILDAKIYVVSPDEDCVDIIAHDMNNPIALGFICQNDIHGSVSPDRLGYNASWAFGIEDIMGIMHLTDDVSNLHKIGPIDMLSNIVTLSFPIIKKRKFI